MAKLMIGYEEDSIDVSVVNNTVELRLTGSSMYEDSDTIYHRLSAVQVQEVIEMLRKAQEEIYNAH